MHESHSTVPYERRDANLKTLMLFGVGLAALTVAVLLVMWLMFRAFGTIAIRRDTPPSPLADTRQPPPGPRLQVAPAQDLNQLRAREDALLNHYTWIDKETGVVRIPIDRAMELLAQRGLPVRKPEN
jgi:hypothetical protein